MSVSIYQIPESSPNLQHCSRQFLEQNLLVVEVEALHLVVAAEQSWERQVEVTAVVPGQQLRPCTVDNTGRRLHIHHTEHMDRRQQQQNHSTERTGQRNQLQRLDCQHQALRALLGC